jgi:hypothetical protein
MGEGIRIGLAVAVVLALPLVVLITSVVQKSTISRQRRVLADLEQVFGSVLSYKSAVSYFDRRMPAGIILFAPGYSIPIATLFAIILAVAAIVWFAPTFSPVLAEPDYLLGGIYVFSKPELEPSEIETIQSQTLACIAFAFLSAYLVIIYRLIVRINNNDISPIAYYFFAFHIFGACIMAAIVRHILLWLQPSELAGTASDPSVPYHLAAIGFVIGMRPDLWTAWIADWVKKRVGIAQPTPLDPKNAPASGDLMVIEGLTDEKRDRFLEMSVDSCHSLAQQNIFVIWARTTFNMPQILDWIGQAMLYLIVKQDTMRKLRDNGIRDIFAYVVHATVADTTPLERITGFDPKIIKGQIAALAENPAYQRLLEVRAKLAPSATTASVTLSPPPPPSSPPPPPPP